jgi:hypothetical protein
MDHDNQTTRRVLDGIGDYREVLIAQFGLALDDGELAAIAEAMAQRPADDRYIAPSCSAAGGPTKSPIAALDQIAELGGFNCTKASQ